MSNKRFNVTRARKETMKSGEEKTFWDNVGSIIIFTNGEDGSESGYLKLNMFDEKYNIFPVKAKDEMPQARRVQPQTTVNQNTNTDFSPNNEVNVDSIPF